MSGRFAGRSRCTSRIPREFARECCTEAGDRPFQKTIEDISAKVHMNVRGIRENKSNASSTHLLHCRNDKLQRIYDFIYAIYCQRDLKMTKIKY